MFRLRDDAQRQVIRKSSPGRVPRIFGVRSCPTPEVVLVDVLGMSSGVPLCFWVLLLTFICVLPDSIASKDF